MPEGEKGPIIEALKVFRTEPALVIPDNDMGTHCLSTSMTGVVLDECGNIEQYNPLLPPSQGLQEFPYFQFTNVLRKMRVRNQKKQRITSTAVVVPPLLPKRKGLVEDQKHVSGAFRH